MKKKKVILQPFVANQQGIAVKRCCASCMKKKFGPEGRMCVIRETKVKSGTVCSLWEMSTQCMVAGIARGKVKRKAYLDHLLSERNDEQLARDLGMRIMPKSIDEIREEFEKEFGSIYIEM